MNINRIEITSYYLPRSLIKAKNCVKYKNNYENYSIAQIENLDMIWHKNIANKIEKGNVKVDYITFRVPVKKPIFIFRKKEVIIKPNEYHIGNIRELYQSRFHNKHQTYNYVGFQFSPAFFTDLFESIEVRASINSLEFYNRPIKQTTFIKNVISLAMEAVSMISHDGKKSTIASSLLLDTIALQLGVYLLRKHPNSIQGFIRGNKNGCKRDPRIQKLLDFIRDNYSKKLSLDDLSQAVCLSKWRVLELFKSGIGKSPMAYLNDYRIKKATELIKNSDKKLQEIAKLVGFVDASHLAKVFYRYYKLSPSSLARNRR